MSYDLAIVGAGPAGLATAIHARLAGLSAIVLERRPGALDKACGEGVMPAGVRALAAMGVAVAVRVPFEGVCFVDAEGAVTGRFAGGAGWGVRRLRLSEALMKRASELGAEIDLGCAVRGIEAGERPHLLTSRGRVDARFVAGADGLHSTVRRLLGLHGAHSGRYGMRRHFAVAPWSSAVEVHWAPGFEAYVTPVAPQEVSVALLWPGEPVSFEALLARLPLLGERLAGARPTSSVRGAGPMALPERAVAARHVALVGDASGYVDALSGEGVSLAFGAARALVAALVAGDLAGYAAEHRRLYRGYRLLTRLLLELGRSPRLRARLMRALAREPTLWDELTRAASGEAPLRLVTLARAAGLALGPGGGRARA